MAASPTGCFKCGRPGHWSRDCPSTPVSNAANPSPSFPRPPPAKAAAAEGEEGKGKGKGQKKKKERATRPKLTADLLLSDDGLGYALRHFPKAFKCHGRPGHEVEELGNLIRLYMEWHSRLIPYYSFEQFVRKVEQVGASKRVRQCIIELKERVARGGDLTILHELPVEEVMPECDPDSTAPEGRALGTAAPLDNLDAISAQEDIDPPLETNDVDPMQEDLLNEIYRGTAGEPQGRAGEVTIQEAPQPSASTEEDLHGDPSGDAQNHQDQATPAAKPGKIQVTDEQRARMEANRLKALERAAARARASQPS